MSGDVQPRKRKDKKKAKRDSLDRRSEGEIFTRKQSLREDEEVKESHHGVHAEKMGKDDLHLHVQGDHETGGHWCAKLFFFSLMAILVGIVGLIILENRGSADVDTPLSESRFSEYFEGWVDEHRLAHDDHHSPSPGLDDHGGPPFEEEEDHSEPVDDDHDVADDHDEDDEDDNDNEVLGDDDNEDQNDEADDESNAEDNEDDDDEEPEVNRIQMSTQNARNKREIDTEDNDEGFEDDGNDNDEDNEEINDSATNDDDNNDDDDQNDDNNADDDANAETPFEEDDDDDFDDADESAEKVVDNDAGEELHLRRKAEQEELAARAAAAIEDESESAPLAVKIAVGLALAFVARLVLVKKTQPSKPDEPVEGSSHVKRRFTMISAEDDIPVENEEILDDEYDEEYSDQEEDEEEEEEEDDPELQYSEEADEDVDNDNNRVEKYVPETFEQLNAMFRSKPSDNEPIKTTATEKPIERQSAKSVESAPSPIVAKEEPKKVVIDNTPKLNVVQSTAPPINNQQGEPTSEYLQKQHPKYLDDEDLEVEEEIGDEEEMEDDEEIYSGSEDDADEEISDVDDDDLMRRLEEKYGKLADQKYDSDEEDLDEQSWTKVRGPQAYLDDDSYIDDEIRRANAELFNDQFDFQ